MIFAARQDLAIEAVQWRGHEFTSQEPGWLKRAFEQRQIARGLYLVDRLYIRRLGVSDVEPLTVMPGDWVFVWPGTDTLAALPDAVFKAQFDMIEE